jgi:hypothetical protein
MAEEVQFVVSQIDLSYEKEISPQRNKVPFFKVQYTVATSRHKVLW